LSGKVKFMEFLQFLEGFGVLIGTDLRFWTGEVKFMEL
jgi:hypothetical protein